MSIEQWSDLMFPEAGERDAHLWGSVKAVNSDGSYQVQLNKSNVTTRCSAGCTAGVGDRVLVCIMANGRCAACGRLEGAEAEFKKPVRFDGDITYSKPGMFHYSGGTGGTAGYVKICSIKHTSAYHNAGMSLVISQRDKRNSIVHVVFTNSSVTDIAGLAVFSVDGPANVYGVISGSRFDVYVQKSETWDYVALVDAWSNNGYMGDWLDTGTDFVTSLPSGYKTAVRTILDDAYPVGAVYISYVSTSPASLFGGTWTAITGRFPYFNAGTDTGGSNTHTLTKAQIPAHQHEMPYWAGWGSGGSSGDMMLYGAAYTRGRDDWCYTKTDGGSGGSHNNMPAYQTLYAWRRTA